MDLEHGKRETPPRKLEATPLLSIAKLTSITPQVIELIKKLRKKKKTYRNKTHAVIGDGEPIAIYTTKRHYSSF